VNKKLSLGLAVNYVFGNNEKSIEEKWFSSNITITDEKKHDFKGFFINGGFNLEMTEKFSLAGIFRTPYIKKSDSQSLLRYFSPGGDTDIRIDAVGNNSYNQPFVVGLGLQYVFSKNFRAAADFNFFDWSSYKIDYFNEELDRNFKNVLKIGTGVEYSMPAKFIRQDIRVFYRLGASYDPQPMKIADSYYLGLTLGTGIQWRRYFLDLGILLAQEFGSGDDLNSRVFVITLGHK
jgi:long-subunit fatty acid transport protein